MPAATSSTAQSTALDLSRVLRQIDSLRRMTIERGCTPSEADTAALKIGQAVQRYRLVVRPPAGAPQVTQRAVVLEGVEVLAETELALLCLIGEEEHWVPRSQLCPENEVCEPGDIGLLVVRRWFAEKRGLCPSPRR